MGKLFRSRRHRRSFARAVAEALESRVLLSSNIGTVAAFNDVNGAYPYGSVIFDNKGNLYGTTSAGLYGGTIYEIANNSATVTTLYSFNSPTTDGKLPESGLLMDTSENLYGTTFQGGADNDGVVYELPKGSTTIKILGTFTGANGANPLSGVAMDIYGDLWGTTDYGGAYSAGAVYEIPSGTSAITLRYSFNLVNGNPQNPSGLSRDASGNLFGTTGSGGANGLGSIFKIPNGGTTPQTVASFNGTNGATPSGVSIIDGKVYGTAYSGGADGLGVVYDLAGNVINDIAAFAGPVDSPKASIVMGQTGNIYGTTADSTTGDGAIYEIANGTTNITTLYNFNGTNGQDPWDTLTLDAGGNLYGTTRFGGTDNEGLVFGIQRASVGAEHLVFTKQPTTAAAGAAISPAFTVAVEGSTNQVVVGDTSTITLSIASSPSAQLYGTYKLKVTNGVATFASVNLWKTGTFKLEATDGTDTAATSAAFVITPAAASKLVFSAQPKNETAGATLPAVTVTVEDRYGNVVTTNTSSITLALATSPIGGKLDGTLIEKAIKGVATFANLYATESGTYMVRAVDSALTAATSTKFVIGSAAASKVVFTTQPANATTGASLGSVKVTIEDKYGNLVATSSTTVTLSIATGAAGASLSGTTKIAAINGVATFSTLKLNKAGTYTLKAADGVLTLSDSKSFTIA